VYPGPRDDGGATEAAGDATVPAPGSGAGPDPGNGGGPAAGGLGPVPGGLGPAAGGLGPGAAGPVGAPLDAPEAGDGAGTPAGRHDAGRHGRPSRPLRSVAGEGWRGLLRAEGRAIVLLLGGGLLVAAAWRLLAPGVADTGNPLESAAAVDGTLAVLGVFAGVATAASVLLWPGPLPTRRTLVVLVFSLIASLLSWQVGDLLGEPELRANGVALVWPIITAGGLFAGSLLPVLSRRLES
jgi:hypothetical protein